MPQARKLAAIEMTKKRSEEKKIIINTKINSFHPYISSRHLSLALSYSFFNLSTDWIFLSPHTMCSSNENHCNIFIFYSERLNFWKFSFMKMHHCGKCNNFDSAVTTFKVKCKITFNMVKINTFLVYIYCNLDMQERLWNC